MKKSGQWRTIPENTTATSIIQGIGPQKHDKNFKSRLVFFSSISFGPNCASRFVASTWVSPSCDKPSSSRPLSSAGSAGRS